LQRIVKFTLHLCAIFILVASYRVHAQANSDTQNNVINVSIEASLSDLISADNIKPYLAYFKKNEVVRWQVTLPENYKMQSPQGLLVYISPQDSGEIYDVWKSLLADKNLIWISADKGGNGFSAQRRVLQALLAIQLATKNYKIDKQRIYLAGFSGGGRVASMMVPLYPEVFTGGIFMGGANYWGSEMPEKISLIRKKPYVFINGESDFNLKESKKVNEKFKKSGVGNLEFFEVPGLGHMPPDAKWLAAAIDFLDAHQYNNQLY
jgi:hypothetical protein